MTNATRACVDACRSASGTRRALLRTFGAALVSAALLALVALPARAADMTKVVRQVFPAAETGFDPAGVQDLYSATIEQAVF